MIFSFFLFFRTLIFITLFNIWMRSRIIAGWVLVSFLVEEDVLSSVDERFGVIVRIWFVVVR